MDSGTTIEQARDKAHSKIGRNLLLFQQFERVMKYLAINSDISGPAKELKDSLHKRSETIKGKTLGQVTKDCFETIYSSTDDEYDPSYDSIHLSMRWRIEADDEYLSHKENFHSELLQARNELVHHLLEKHDFATIEGCQKLADELDIQFNRFKPELDLLNESAKTLSEARKELWEWITTDEGQRLIFEGILPGETRLESLLRQVASMTPRDDGWMPLARAGALISSQSPNVLERLYDELGTQKIRNLKKTIESLPQFQLQLEKTDRGEQWLFRHKTGDEPELH